MVLGYLLISSFKAPSPRRYSYTYLSLWCISSMRIYLIEKIMRYLKNCLDRLIHSIS